MEKKGLELTGLKVCKYGVFGTLENSEILRFLVVLVGFSVILTENKIYKR